MKKNRIRVYHVDAFSHKAFGGNPAAVCVLHQPINDQLMHKIAAEMNLSETAFVGISENGKLSLRWFTPILEVELCGHATLAAAKVLFAYYFPERTQLVFDSKSGELAAVRRESSIMLDFPLDRVDEEIQCAAELLGAMGIKSYLKAFIGKKTRKLIIHIADCEEIPLLKPDFTKLSQLRFDKLIKGIGVTARADANHDFVSRYFNPWAGVNEDPVTGSVHTLLADYWSKILNKQELTAYQASARGGNITIKIREQERVELWGEAVIIAAGELFL